VTGPAGSREDRVERDAADRIRTGTPVVYRHNTMMFVVVCPFYEVEACGSGAMHPDYPTERAAQQGWNDHHRLHHATRPSSWPVHIPGQRPRPAPRVKAAPAVDDSQGGLF
jgi:hypothetical protein